jgi:hypothetical protein
MNTQDSIELFETRKKIIKNFVSSHNGVRRKEVQIKLGLGDTFTAELLTKIIQLGELYRSGNGSNIRYWISEDRMNEYNASQVEPPKPKTKPPVIVGRRKPNNNPTMIFLNRKRPAGINTVFEECKQNFGILPVLQVMARRLYG